MRRGRAGPDARRRIATLANLATLVALATLGALAGCSLVSLKSPEKPLSPRDLNTRILTREYAAEFTAQVDNTADSLLQADPSPTVAANALRWKISAALQSQRAAMRIVPLMALLDTWGLSVQMKEFLAPGAPGGALFGRGQATALRVATELNQSAEEMAHQLLNAQEYERDQAFVTGYAREFPLGDLDFTRASVVRLWSQQNGAGGKLVDSLGTIPEALADAGERVEMLGDTLPQQVMWRTELAMRQAGVSGGDVQSAMKQLDARLAAMSNAAENAPELVHDAVSDVRRSLVVLLNRLDVSSAAMIQALREERASLTQTVHTEREAVVQAADVQRRAIAQDASKLADQVVANVGEQVRSLAREVLILLILLAIVLLGLPFAAGYLVGRARRSRQA